MVGDESFSAASLPVEAQTWHTRLLNQNVTLLPVYTNAYNAPDTIAGGEAVGEDLLFAITPLLQAFRMTGDLEILDMADTLMERAVNPLITNGYFLAINHMFHNGLFALVNQMIWVYSLNAGKTSPGSVDYAARRDQWINYMDNTYEPAMGIGPYSNTVLRHRTIAYMRGLYYYWRRTGLSDAWRYDVPSGPLGFYGWRAIALAENRTDFGGGLTPLVGQLEVDDRYIWGHEVPAHTSSSSSFEWQGATYARYVTASIIDLALEGLWPWTDAEMAKYAATSAFIMADGVSNIRENVNSTTKGTMTANQWRASGFIGAARWNAAIKALADSDYVNVVGTNTWFPAWMLMATV